MSNWTANDIPNQAGRTFVVTGANSGLGYIMSLELARHGAHVIMTARNEARGRAAVRASSRLSPMPALTCASSTSPISMM